MTITINQIQAIVNYLKVGGQILDPAKWKQHAIKANYIVASVPALFLVLNAFDITDIQISEELASSLWEILLAAFGIFSNIVLSATSKNVSMNPLNTVSTDSTARDYSDSDE